VAHGPRRGLCAVIVRRVRPAVRQVLTEFRKAKPLPRHTRARPHRSPPAGALRVLARNATHVPVIITSPEHSDRSGKMTRDANPVYPFSRRRTRLIYAHIALCSARVLSIRTTIPRRCVRPPTRLPNNNDTVCTIALRRRREQREPAKVTTRINTSKRSNSSRGRFRFFETCSLPIAFVRINIFGRRFQCLFFFSLFKCSISIEPVSFVIHFLPKSFSICVIFGNCR